MTDRCAYCRMPTRSAAGVCGHRDVVIPDRVKTNRNGALIDKDVQRSRLVFEGYGYTVSIAGFDAKNGPFLCVSRNAKDGTRGRYVQGRAAIRWAEHFDTAIDDKERQMLCSAIYHS